MRLLLAFILCALPALAQIQQHAITTNKIVISNGITNDANNLRINIAPGPGITLTTNNTQITFSAAGAGLGDVTGPAAAVDEDIAVFDGVSGKLIKDSGVLISDLALSGHTHVQLHNRGHSVVDVLDHTDWPATVSLTELGYLDGVVSAIQTQLDNRQATNATLTHLSTNTITGTGRIVLESLLPSGTGDDVWVNHANVSNPNLTNSATITWAVSGTNVSASLVSSYLTEASASVLYQATNANLTLWSGLAPSSKQDADADLTSWAGVTRAAGFDTFTATPSSANLRGAVTDENGTGALLFDGASSLALGSSSFTAITNSALTAGRVIFSGTTKEQADDADLTFATDTLTATKVSAPTAVYMGSFMATNYLYTSSPTNLQAIGLLSLHGLAVTNLTASQAVVTDASKNLASVAYTGAGNVMRTRVGVVRNIWIPASAMNPGASGAPAFSTNAWATTTDAQSLECYDFDDTTNEVVQFTMTLPDAWDGSTVKAKFFWKQVSASSSTNVWGIVGGSLTDNETGGNTLGTAVTVQDVGLNDTNKVAISSATGALTIGGTPSAGHFIWFKVYRDADATEDNMSGDSRLIGVQLQYTETTTEPSAW